MLFHDKFSQKGCVGFASLIKSECVNEIDVYGCFANNSIDEIFCFIVHNSRAYSSYTVDVGFQDVLKYSDAGGQSNGKTNYLFDIIVESDLLTSFLLYLCSFRENTRKISCFFLLENFSHFFILKIFYSFSLPNIFHKVECPSVSLA